MGSSTKTGKTRSTDESGSAKPQATREQVSSLDKQKKPVKSKAKGNLQTDTPVSTNMSVEVFETELNALVSKLPISMDCLNEEIEDLLLAVENALRSFEELQQYINELAGELGTVPSNLNTDKIQKISDLAESVLYRSHS